MKLSSTDILFLRPCMFRDRNSQVKLCSNRTTSTPLFNDWIAVYSEALIELLDLPLSKLVETILLFEDCALPPKNKS